MPVFLAPARLAGGSCSSVRPGESGHSPAAAFPVTLLPVRNPFVAALLVMGSILVVRAAALVPPELVALSELVMNDRPSVEELRRSAAEAAGIGSRIEDPADRLRHVAMLEFLVGFGELGMGLRSEADASFQRAADFARRSNRVRETSEAARVLADALNQLLGLRGAGYRVLYASRARTAAHRAVELDPANPFAHLALAAFLASAPPVAGGDPQAAQHHLGTAASLTDDRLARFLIAIWNARIIAATASAGGAPADQSDQSDEALAEAIGKAYAIFPRNWWLAEVAADLGMQLPE